MRDELWWPLRKTSSIIHVEYGHTHATLFATDVRVQKGPPLTIGLDLGKNLRSQKAVGTYIDATELARGEISRLKSLEVDDAQIINNLARTLEHTEDRSIPWKLLVALRGEHGFVIEPEYKKFHQRRVLVLHVVDPFA